MREIKVIANSQNRNETYMSDANTFGELKAELLNKGYEVDGMDFKEGKSRIDLKDDFSPLPSNFMYKGEMTSDLVIMIAPANTKIKSGAYSRAELYNKVKEYGLQDTFYEDYNKNFTNASNQELAEVVEAYEEAINRPASVAQPHPEALKPMVREVVNEELDKRDMNSEYNLNSVARCLLKIIDFIERIGWVSSKICNNWKKSIRKDYEPYTAEELNDMM